MNTTAVNFLGEGRREPKKKDAIHILLRAENFFREQMFMFEDSRGLSFLCYVL